MAQGRCPTIKLVRALALSTSLLDYAKINVTCHSNATFSCTYGLSHTGFDAPAGSALHCCSHCRGTRVCIRIFTFSSRLSFNFFINSVHLFSRHAKGEIGLAYIDLMRPELHLASFPDSATYMRAVTKLHVHTPSELIFPATVYDGSGASKLYTILSENFGAETNFLTVNRKHFNDAQGKVATLIHINVKSCQAYAHCHCRVVLLLVKGSMKLNSSANQPLRPYSWTFRPGKIPSPVGKDSTLLLSLRCLTFRLFPVFICVDIYYLRCMLPVCIYYGRYYCTAAACALLKYIQSCKNMVSNIWSSVRCQFLVCVFDMRQNFCRNTDLCQAIAQGHL